MLTLRQAELETTLPGDAAKPPARRNSAPRTSMITRNIRLSHGRTSVRLAPLEWRALALICRREGMDRHQFAARVLADPLRCERTLTSRLRAAILAYYMAASGIEEPN